MLKRRPLSLWKVFRTRAGVKAFDFIGCTPPHPNPLPKGERGLYRPPRRREDDENEQFVPVYGIEYGLGFRPVWVIKGTLDSVCGIMRNAAVSRRKNYV
jgi:hypothetical protein